jgi:hypothetical protein
MQTFEWPIEDIVLAHPGLYLEHCAVMAVALMSRLSEAPCGFFVECEGFCPPDLDGETAFALRVSWDEQTARDSERVWRTEQPRPIVERAAVALAALLLTHLIPGSQLRVTDTGDRADYWLPQLRLALEVSGTEHRRELAARHREKTAQLLANPRQWDGYVLLCCFDPALRLIRWSYHSQEELENVPS